MTKKHNNSKQVQEALDLLSKLDENQAAAVLANVKAPALSAAIKARKEREAAQQEEQRKALQKALAEVGKILDKAGITKSVRFDKSETGWEPKLIGSGGGGGGGRKKALTDNHRKLIDEALNGGKAPKPGKVRENGTISTFMFGDVEIPTVLICYRLIEHYDATTDKQIIDMVGKWGVRDTQARGALNRHSG